MSQALQVKTGNTPGDKLIGHIVEEFGPPFKPFPTTFV
jgi:hypothetical protein